MMYNTFNMGIGMVLAVDPEDVDSVMKAIRSTGDTPYVIGHIENGEKEYSYAKISSSRLRRRHEPAGDPGCD